MFKHHVFNILFLILISQVSAETTLDVLDVCSENSPLFFSPQTSLETFEKIKASLIDNPQTKQLLLENASEQEQVKNKLLKCVEELLKRNHFKVLEKMIEDVLDPLDIDVSNHMKLLGNQIKKEIDTVVNKAHAKRNTQIISPVFQWVQSESHIFLQIKFAHRHDAPGCLEVKNEQIEFTPNGFYFSGFGIQAQQPIHFVLNLTFFQDINPEQSTWKLESVGRLFVSVAKANPEVWVFLLKDNEKLPGMRIWWEMKDNYKDAMNQYDKLLEKMEELALKEKRKSKKEKKQEEPQPIDDEL